MPTVQLSHINKTYGTARVVDDVSFEVDGGEIFALIGPNGAGKSTTIRMMMDIIKPDSGEILINGDHLGEAAKNRIGYLPEERGLYRKLKIIDTIVYLASLKGADTAAAVTRAENMLRKFDLFDHRFKKIEELSKGMGQLTQFVVTVAHNPDLIILDEPFAGLDPVNSRLLKDTIRELRAEGKAVILSTHRMNEVQEMCDRLFMINKGRRLLYGKLDDIRRQYRAHAAVVESPTPLPENLTGVLNRQVKGNLTELQLDTATSPQALLTQLVSAGVAVERFEVVTPSLDEIFVRVVKQS
ncbi:MAG: ATP-binding cassette domain-containing protein [Dehalogenimonas sp.]|uniref:ATP-binding cassette domain-containing protein n=1 Tax=Candidatus Dehalogenimonas loeffleri TaxID=3127115 RepID=A0ABZ2J6T7_9CHLR|nr:ATP-binding cassette domain-containing protein [Dehalogenimonas sp.]